MEVFTYLDAPGTIKRRLKYNNVCPICKKNIKVNQSCVFLKHRNGRRINYFFFHLDCLYEEVFNGKEETTGTTEGKA